MSTPKKIIYFSRQSVVFFSYMLPIWKKTGGIFITESESLYNFVRSHYPTMETYRDRRKNLSRYHPGAIVLAGDERKIPPRYKLVQIFHGLADKRAVYDKRNFKVRESLLFLISRFIEHHLPGCFHKFSLLSEDMWWPLKSLRMDRLVRNRYSLFCLTGKHMEEKLRLANVLTKNNWRAVGFPRLDCLANNELSREEIIADLKLNPDYKTILYAPTWHGVGKINLSSIPDLGIKVCQAVGSEVNFIFKPHPNIIANDEFPEAMRQIGGYIENHPNFFYPDPKIDTIRLMYISDLMITDFSSVAVDYLAFDRPMVFMDHLGERWDDSDLVEVWIRQAGEIVRDPDQIWPTIQNSLNDPSKRSKMRQKFRDCFFYALDGKASERAADAILELAGLGKK
jgi:CDP-glycerol glycerophosphotransferase (TagB/SpsB family)